MKVYFVSADPHKEYNPYIAVLWDSLLDNHSDIELYYGYDLFWTDEVLNMDIIHIQWPDCILKNTQKRQITATQAQDRLLFLKEKGIKIVSTCHNFKPHVVKVSDESEVFDIVYKNSDAIFHLWKYSLSVFEQQYPQIQNLLLPHQIYDTIYKNLPTREKAIKKLHLNPKKKYILAFGAFRTQAERDLVINVSKILNKENVEILAPHFTTVSPIHGIIHSFYVLFKKLYFKTKYRNLHLHPERITDDELLYYYAACDIAFIHRPNILNSGNVPMGFLFKKVVVGPQIGNVGCLLQDMGNPTFDPNNTCSVIDSIRQGLYLAKNGLGDKNYEYAKKNFSTSLIADKLYHYYKILSKKNG